MNITLALSGGGLKGFAHIGTLRVLEAEGFRIRGVAGTSAGGLVGALYTAGYSPDQMEARLRDIQQGREINRCSFSHQRGSWHISGEINERASACGRGCDESHPCY